MKVSSALINARGVDHFFFAKRVGDYFNADWQPLFIEAAGDGGGGNARKIYRDCVNISHVHLDWVIDVLADFVRGCRRDRREYQIVFLK